MASRSSSAPLRLLAWLLAALSLMASPAMAAPLTFTLTTSEPAVVTGTPRIAIDVGGVTRYASYAAGSGTTALTFSYAVQQGDFDPDGIEINPAAIDLNGGNITDGAGNPLSSLGFAPPPTVNIRVQTYQTAFTQALTSANAGAAGFTISRLPSVAGNSYTYSYTITGSNGGSLSAGPIAFSGSTVTVSGVDLSAFPRGDVTLAVTVTGPSGTGQPVSVTVTPAFTGPLDALPVVASAYSVRLLRSAYGGPLMRVRRLSDNAEQNIGATLAGTLDIAALGSFCGTSSCFVSTWYDQSPAANNAVQAVADNQPRIMAAGVVEKNGSGHTALRTLTAYSALNAPAPMANSAEFTIVMATQAASTATFQWAWGMAAWPGQVSSNCPWSDGFCYFDVGSYSGAQRIKAPSGVIAGAPYVAMFGNSVTESTQFIRINGTLRASDSSGHSAALQGLAIMNTYEYLGQKGYPGQIGTVSEFLVFPSLLSPANRQSVEQSMAQAHGP